jgi:hypothetical protein
MKGARTDEKFHVQSPQPTYVQSRFLLYQKTTWSNLVNPDGSAGSFVSIWVWNLQWYYGTTKCDGTRTYMLNKGELGDPTTGYVMTTTPKELLAFRWRAQGPGSAAWNNMGGS